MVSHLQTQRQGRRWTWQEADKEAELKENNSLQAWKCLFRYSKARSYLSLNVISEHLWMGLVSSAPVMTWTCRECHCQTFGPLMKGTAWLPANALIKAKQAHSMPPPPFTEIYFHNGAHYLPCSVSLRRLLVETAWTWCASPTTSKGKALSVCTASHTAGWSGTFYIFILCVFMKHFSTWGRGLPTPGPWRKVRGLTPYKQREATCVVNSAGGKIQLLEPTSCTYNQWRLLRDSDGEVCQDVLKSWVAANWTCDGH